MWKTSVIILLTLLSAQPLFSRDYEMRILPGEMNQARTLNRVDVRPGYWNRQALGLADGGYDYDSDTELFFEFNSDPSAELSGNSQPYTVLQTGVHIQQNSAYRGQASAMVIPGNPLVLRAGDDSIFAPGQVWTDFSMEFWMYPAVFNDGELLFQWKGTSWLQDKPFMQDIEVRADRGRLSWKFTDFFILLNEAEDGTTVLDKKSIVLSSRSEIVPRRWSHHMIRYDSSTGMLEYLINGVSESVEYATSMGSESGATYLPYVGEQSERMLSIAPAFHGFLDDFRISRTWQDAPNLAVAERSPGYAVVGPVDLGYDGIVLTGLDATYRTPGQTDIRISVAQRDAFQPLTEREYDGEDVWRIVEPGSTQQRLIPNGFGRYLYFKIDFLPDGTDKNIPLLQDISITYERDPAPPAPVQFAAVSKDGSIGLEWSEVLSENVEGYLLYFGESPDHYFGADESGMVSPIDVGDVDRYQLDGLINGKMYYFKLASYNSYNNPGRGLYRERNFSEEVYARPSRIQ